jgi:hypothetical protein
MTSSKVALREYFPKDKNLDEYITNSLHKNNMNINCKVLKEEI